MHKTKIEKFHLIITIILILQSIVNFSVITYACFWFVMRSGFEPLYGLWFQNAPTDILLIILLSFKKLRVLGFTGMIYKLINGVLFIAGPNQPNSMYWLKHGYPLWSVEIFLWYIEIVLALIGIFLWWWQLRGRRVRANHA